jgi:hypothetical protein
VILPKWAQTPEEFLRKHREALESEHVSLNLHKWIDLIFGVKQCSIEDNNVFHPVTYQGKVDLKVLQDPVQRLAFETQISEFGQTPKKIDKIDSEPIPALLVPKVASAQPVAKSEPVQEQVKSSQSIS